MKNIHKNKRIHALSKDELSKESETDPEYIAYSITAYELIDENSVKEEAIKNDEDFYIPHGKVTDLTDI